MTSQLSYFDLVPSKHPYHLQVIVPSIDRGGQPVADELRQSVIAKLRGLLSDWAGGYISIGGDGGWTASNGIDVTEPITTLDSYGHSPVESDLLREIVSLVVIQLDQDCAAVILNGTMLLYDRADVEAPDVL